MAKFVGFKCDVCNNAEDGNDAPADWLRLRLPANNGATDNTRDLCSDKCLLKFAKERNGITITTRKGGSGKSDPALLAFIKSRGKTGSSLGGIIGTHVRRRHEIAGAVDDCLVCEFLTREEK